MQKKTWKICSVVAIFGLVSSVVLGAGRTGAEPMRIFVAGDSTAAVYGPERYPQTGWAMVLQCGLRDAVVFDYAKAGRSTKSFLAEGRLDEIAAQLLPGDTFLIGFGHNDEKADDPSRFTDPDGDFRTYLKIYIDTVRKHGAMPVLLTPVTRRSFEGGAVVDTHAIYADAVRAVASETKTPLIDLDGVSRAWVSAIGREQAKKYYLYVTPGDRYPWFPAGSEDDTHFTELGARAIANLVAGELLKLNLPISRHVLKVRPALSRPVGVGGPFCQ